MKILYLHGLNSTLHQDRKEALEKYTQNIHAPSLDYENNPQLLSEFLSQPHPYDIIIGSSAGGLLGFYLANQWQIPSLLFNPALPFAKNIQDLPKLRKPKAFMQICIGAEDEVVNPNESLAFLNNPLFKRSKIHINLRKEMEHPLPIEWFTEELNFFISKINHSPISKKH